MPEIVDEDFGDHGIIVDHQNTSAHGLECRNQAVHGLRPFAVPAVTILRPLAAAGRGQASFLIS
jgi:hypothetical protein